MKLFFTEKNLAAALFVLVLITFSMAQKDTQKMERFYNGSVHTSLQTSLRSILDSKLNIEAATKLTVAEKIPIN